MKYLVLTKINKDLQNLLSNEKIYLGPWCNDDFSENSETIKYHWRNAKDIQKPAEYVYFLYKKILPIISDKLNEILKVDYNHDFWSLLIGPWLYEFLSVYYDKYLSIKNFLDCNNGQIIKTSIYRDKIIFKTYQDFTYNIENSVDEYSHYLYGSVIQYLNTDIDIDLIKLDNVKNLTKKNNKPIQKISLLNVIRRFYYKIKSAYLFYFKNSDEINDTVLLNHDIKNPLLFYKLSKNKNVPFLWNLPLNKITKKLNLIDSPSDDLRFNKLTINKIYNDDEFCSILEKALLDNIPIEYLENFKNNVDAISPYIKKDYKFLISKWIFVNRSFMRYYIALQKNIGSKIISLQKGGNFGIRKLYNCTNIEIDLSDYYLSWGWKNSKDVTSFYFTKNYWIQKHNYNKNDPIVFIGVSCRKFFYNFLHSPSIIYNNEHLELNINFFKIIYENVQNKIIYRFYNNYGFNEQLKIKKEFPKLKQSHREDTPHFYHLLYKSSLLICTNDVTTHKQAFIINKPTVMLFKMDFFTIKNEFLNVYQALKDAEIFFEDPVLCANKINQIYKDPMSWWMLPKVQEAKNLYLNSICKFSDKLEHELAEKIKEFRRF